jgi:hypothetical protein
MAPRTRIKTDRPYSLEPELFIRPHSHIRSFHVRDTTEPVNMLAS